MTDGEMIFVNLLRIFFIITSPATFLVGLYLLYDVETYQKIEKFLAKTYGASKKLIKSLEVSRESFQMFLLQKRRIVGAICVLNSLFAILAVLFFLRRY